MIEAYKKMLQNYATFSGRTNLKDFWLAFLANFIIGIVLGIITILVPQLNFLSYIYSLAVLIPSLAIVVRRLHDIGKSGSWWFICLVPLVGGIILIVFLATQSGPDNAYGPNENSTTVNTNAN